MNLKNLHIQGEVKIRHMVDPLFLFFNLNKKLPNVIGFIKINPLELRKKIQEKFKVKKDDIITYFVERKGYEEENAVSYESLLFIMIKKDLYIVYDEENKGTFVYYSHKYIGSRLLENLKQTLEACRKKEKFERKIHLICDDGGLYLKDFNVKPTHLNIQKNYNLDFLEVNKTIQSFIKEENKNGLILLHGIPGTGKTTYIRHLITNSPRRVIYIPADSIDIISSPKFLSFLIDYPGSVLVIEDAESALEQRKGGDSPAVANLLNLCDGLLSDCLDIRVICTFNIDISKIDKALLRKGRLVEKYEFKELNKAEAQLLSDSLGFKTVIDRDMTVGEIYNQSHKHFEHNGVAKVGFQTN